MTKEKKKPYFGQREEDAVVEYKYSTSASHKNKIYSVILQEPFKKMIQSILRRYPIHLGNYSIEDVEAFILTHLIEQMVKFDEERILKCGKKAKAYSYCQTIVRNYCKDHSKKTYQEKKINLNYDDYSEDIMSKSDYIYELDDDHRDPIEKLIDIIINKINTILDDEDFNLKKNEILVGNAIVNILVNWHVLFMEETPEGKYQKKITNKYKKNKVLLLLKEQTGLSTKEIRMFMKPFKEIYLFEKEAFFIDNE